MHPSASCALPHCAAAIVRRALSRSLQSMALTEYSVHSCDAPSFLTTPVSALFREAGQCLDT